VKKPELETRMFTLLPQYIYIIRIFSSNISGILSTRMDKFMCFIYVHTCNIDIVLLQKVAHDDFSSLNGYCAGGTKGAR
jgi:hypothetical protein